MGVTTPPPDFPQIAMVYRFSERGQKEIQELLVSKPAYRTFL